MKPNSESELWFGMVEMKPLDQKANGAAGAFTNIVTWARDAEEFRRKAEIIAAELDLYVFEIEGAEPMNARTRKCGLSEAVEEMVLRAECNPNAIVFGTFHRYPHNEA
jgi:hypothetical protein